MNEYKELKSELVNINRYHGIIYAVMIFSFILTAFSIAGLFYDDYFSLSITLLLPSMIFSFNALYLVVTTSRVFATILSLGIFIIYNVIVGISGYEMDSAYPILTGYFLLCWSLLFVVSICLNNSIIESKDSLQNLSEKLLKAYGKQSLSFSDKEIQMLKFLLTQPYNASYKNKMTFAFFQKLPLPAYFRYSKYFLLSRECV